MYKWRDASHEGGVPQKESRKRQKERQNMPKFIVVLRFEGREISRRGFVHKDAAMRYARGVKTSCEIEPDGPQFEASVYAL